MSKQENAYFVFILPY